VYITGYGSWNVLTPEQPSNIVDNEVVPLRPVVATKIYDFTFFVIALRTIFNSKEINRFDAILFFKLIFKL
jgi:hypothetical protein